MAESAINVYHSRFRYKDRSSRHRRVIDLFKKEDEATILVATQVAEMALDISADLLVTDIAPVPSLIQRMGRLNRRSMPDNPQPAKLAIVRTLPPDEFNIEMPYTKPELEMASRWLDSLVARNHAISQRDLSEAFSEFGGGRECNIAEAEERAVFFSGLWRTRPGITRGEGHTVTVILEGDLEVCKERDRQGEPTREWLRKYEVSIPIKEEVMKWVRIGTMRVAPSEAVEYDYSEALGEGTGAKWRKS
jgi:CRISPR-associated endonuclease/helicase Cas3